MKTIQLIKRLGASLNAFAKHIAEKLLIGFIIVLPILEMVSCIPSKKEEIARERRKEEFSLLTKSVSCNLYKFEQQIRNVREMDESTRQTLIDSIRQIQTTML